jgi:uncharacterized membrane protein
MSAPRTPRWTDRQIDGVIGRLLQIGVLVAAVVTFVGGGTYLAHHGGTAADFATFRGAPDALRSVSAIVRGVVHGQPAALVQLGLVLLILTPMARVALTLCAFLVQRDRMYVLLTTIVLAILVYGMFLA